MKPYYSDDAVTIYHGDCLDLPDFELLRAQVVLTDPPYGIDYQTSRPRLEGNARSIEGDGDTAVRDAALVMLTGRPALVFGSPKVPAPVGTRLSLVWDQMGALGMGDLSLPWKPSWQFIHVVGGPWTGTRDMGAVYRCAPVQSVARAHPHQKPVELLIRLLDKCVPGAVVDPFMGSGSTLRAAKDVGRQAIGIEIEERYCEIAAKRLAQEVLPLGAA